MLYSNHSCDANLGLRGNIIFVVPSRYSRRGGTDP